MSTASTSDIHRQNGQTYLTVTQVAAQLHVTDRTIRRYVEDGIAAPNGERLKLSARLVGTSSGQEYQIGQSELDEFLKQRSQAIKERQQSHTLPAAHLVVGELEQERLHADLQQALEIVEQQAARIERQAETIERLATEKGQYEGEVLQLRQQLAALQAEHQQGFLLKVFRWLLGVPSLPPEQQKKDQ